MTSRQTTECAVPAAMHMHYFWQVHVVAFMYLASGHFILFTPKQVTRNPTLIKNCFQAVPL